MGYNRGQNASCQCVPKDDFKTATETTLKSFYGKYNKEKLNKKGEIKDVEEVWKKWKGKEPDMFLALASKYKDKAVEIREKPKPPPYKPPSEYDVDGDAETANEAGSKADAAAPEPAAPEDPEEIAFKEKRIALMTKKREAKEAEDYDTAGEAKEELEELVKAEEARLTAKKKQAIADEDFIEAKKIKQRLAKLSEL